MLEHFYAYQDGFWNKRHIDNQPPMPAKVHWVPAEPRWTFGDAEREAFAEQIDAINPDVLVHVGPRLVCGIGGVCISKRHILVALSSYLDPIGILRHELFHSVIPMLNDQERANLTRPQEDLANDFMTKDSELYAMNKELFGMIDSGELYSRYSNFL